MTQCNIKLTFQSQAPRNSKWSKSGKKGATHPMLSMAYNIISCKRINQGNKKIKIPGFTRDVIWGSELRYVEKLLFTRVVESRFTQFWYDIYQVVRSESSCQECSEYVLQRVDGSVQGTRFKKIFNQKQALQKTSAATISKILLPKQINFLLNNYNSLWERYLENCGHGCKLKHLLFLLILFDLGGGQICPNRL